jgi:hypothetical protein
MNRTKAVLLTVVLYTFSIASADVFWSNPNGTADSFDWANGHSLYGLFGDPMLVGGNTLVFSPSNFIAESTDGQSSDVSDKLEFELIIHPGFSFQGISITEYGNYGISRHGEVEASGTLSVENLDTAEVLSQTLSTTPSMPAHTGQGSWEGWSEISIDPAGWTRVKITFENNLFAMTGGNSVAWIEKTVLGNAISFQIIPEPATVAALTFGSLWIFRTGRPQKRTLART